MVNLEHPELKEIEAPEWPQGPPDALRAHLVSMRNELCSTGAGSGFKLQSQQRFLRRVLSPDAPTRNLLMVHGTGTGKTCTAIQIAEEYILRPEFQDKKVMVVASTSVEKNFRTQIFDMTRVIPHETSGILESKQCTGRRYLDMLLRMEQEPKNWNDPTIRTRLETTANRIVNEFYEFSPYATFGNLINSRLGRTEEEVDEEWVHENFDNRLLIIDEAHNIRESSSVGSNVKAVVRGVENLVKTAKGLVLVLLTATPMYDSFEEIVFYMNLFLWNDRKQAPTDRLEVKDFFTPDGSLLPGEAGERFRHLCQDYVSFVKGENPFTFPFRLPPPTSGPAKPITKSYDGKALGQSNRMRYLTVFSSPVNGIQKATLKTPEKEEGSRRVLSMQSTISVLPGNKTFGECFRSTGSQYEYAVAPFLTPTELPNHSAKFVSVLNALESSKGLAFVFSNFVEMGASLFAMALEEHGYTPARGEPLLKNKAFTGASKGKYVLLTSASSMAELAERVKMTKSKDNVNGQQVRVIISSPIVSEGVDFRYVRQVHVLDPWWNMSRIEQVIGRGLRTCSHQLLDFKEQNCSVYLHTVRREEGRQTHECYDEYIYRTMVVPKAEAIARVRAVISESAMDCPLQDQINTLPDDWKNLEITQTRSEGGATVVMALGDMLAPTFDVARPQSLAPRCVPDTRDPPVEGEHTRPLSTYIDSRDEIWDKLSDLFLDKPIWDRQELIDALRPFTEDVVIYNIRQAIDSGFTFNDAFARPSLLESKGDLYALSPIGVPNTTFVERTKTPARRVEPSGEGVSLPEPVEEELPPEEQASKREEIRGLLAERSATFVFPGDVRTRFKDQKVLNGYIFDHLFKQEEKRDFLRAHTAEELADILPFTSRLFVPGTDILVLGDGVLDPPEEPIGADRTRYDEWKSRLLAKFIENKNKLFASVNSDRNLTLSKMKIEGETVSRDIDPSQKRFGPTTCGIGANKKEQMLAFSKFIDSQSVGIPPTSRANKTEWCLFSELLAREQSTDRSVWITPEELDVLFNKENSTAFARAIKG
jgi:hypothetical protein